MKSERTNNQWIEALTATGATQDEALADLRISLASALRTALGGRPDFVGSMVDDIVQQALLKIIGCLHQYEQRSRFVTWACAIAIRVGFTELRSRRWRDVSLDALVDDIHFDLVADETAPSLVQREMVQTLYRLIDTTLTDRQRKALLAELGGMSQDEIARQLDTNRNALYKLIHDARRALRRGLEAEGYGPDDHSGH